MDSQFHCVGTVQEQSLLWSDVMSEEQELQANPTPVSQKLMHDIQVILSRLVAKAPQWETQPGTTMGT